MATQQFGLRGRQENYNLFVELFKFTKDENGRTYAFVAFADSNPMKMRKSPIKLQRRMFNPRMVATSGERCPVGTLKNLSAGDQVKSWKSTVWKNWKNLHANFVDFLN